MLCRPFFILTDDESVFGRFRNLDACWTMHRLAEAEALNHLPDRSLVVLDTAARASLKPEVPVLRAWAARHLIVVISSNPDDNEGLFYLEAGVSGYCHAYAAEATLRQVLEVVASGEQWVGRSLLSRLLKGLDQTRQARTESCTVRLSEREREVALLAAQGQSNQGIANTLLITERTVKAHLSSAFEKLEVADRLQLALKIHGIQP